MKRIKQLEGALCRKTLEKEFLKKAVDFAKEKSELRARLCSLSTNNEGDVRVS